MAIKAPRSKEKSRVFLVDDHPIVRRGLAQLINHESDLCVCGEASNAREAIEQLPDLDPDFLIADISLKGGMDGIDLVKTIRSRNTALPILVVSMHDESLYAERALRAGAMGYIMKQEGTEKVVSAIRRILAGRVYVSDEMDSRLLQQAVGGTAAKPGSPMDLLSNRELEIFGLLGRGMGSRAVAESLYLSVKTVDTYRANIKEKLNLKNSIELMHRAIQWVDGAKAVK